MTLTLSLPPGPFVIPVVLLATAAGGSRELVLGELPSFGAPAVVQEAADEDPRAADRKRILTFADGTLLRDRTRYREGRWERRERREWIPIEGEVVDHALESAVLRSARAMGSEVGRNDHSARAVLADWMVRRGLAEEALGELDRVLANAPDHEGALDVLQKREFPLEMLLENVKGEGLGRLLIAGAQGTPARQEALVWHLARLEGSVDVQKVVESQLQSHQYRRRTFGALAARRLARRPLQKALTDRAVLDTMTQVREQAAFGLRDLEDPQAVGPVVDALDSRFIAVRKNAAEALGNAGYAAAVAPLMAHLSHLQSGGTGKSGVRANLFAGFQTAYVGDYDVEIANGASIADPQVKTQTSGVVFDVRAQAQMTRTITLLAERREVMGALEKLTGKKKVKSPEDWLRWWDQHRAGWDTEPASAEGPRK